MNWIPLESVHDVEAVIERSHQLPCLILKHSTTCPISSLAKHRLEKQWDFPEGRIETYYLDLLRYRSVSTFIAESFDVQHESPQVLLIRDGNCVHDASHLDIRVDDLHQTA